MIDVSSVVQQLQNLGPQPSKKAVRAIAKQFDDHVRGSLVIDEAVMQVLRKVFSTKEIFSLPGTDEFIMTMSFNLITFSESQKNSILLTAKDHYPSYDNEEFCIVMCDFIARNYTPEQTIDFIESVLQTATVNGRYGIRIALDILSWYNTDNKGIMAAISRLQAAATQ